MARIAMALEALSTTVSYYPSPITRTSARAATATGTDDPQQIPSRVQTAGPRVWTPSDTHQRPAPIMAKPQCRRRDITRAPSPRMCDECDSRAARAHESAAASLPTRPTLRVPQVPPIVVAAAQTVGYPDAIPGKRRLCQPRVLPGQSMPRSTVSPLRATRAQRVRQKPLRTKGFQLSMRFGRKASFEHTTPQGRHR
jgi:hypothetical protein